METYVIVIFAILVILTFVVSKNNKRFIIYSITGLKRYFDNKLNLHSYHQKKDLQNLYQNVYQNLYNYVTKDEFVEYINDKFITRDNLKDYALKNDLKSYVMEENLKDYALKNDLQNYAQKDEFQNYAQKDEFQNYVSKKDFLTYTLNNPQKERGYINKTDDTQGSLETEKYKILSKIVDALLKDNSIKKEENNSIKKEENTLIKKEENTLIKKEEKENNSIEKIIMNEKLDSILPPSKLYDTYQPNWFR